MWWRRKRKTPQCTSRWWKVDPSMRCQRPADGHAMHVWSDPGTGRGDDKTFHWLDLP